MGNYTEPRPSAQSTRHASGNGFYAPNDSPAAYETLNGPRQCEACGGPLDSRRRQCRYCSPTCRARAHDKRTGRTSHTKA